LSPAHQPAENDFQKDGQGKMYPYSLKKFQRGVWVLLAERLLSIKILNANVVDSILDGKSH
jgi:hypothetical protein